MEPPDFYIYYIMNNQENNVDLVVLFLKIDYTALDGQCPSRMTSGHANSAVSTQCYVTTNNDLDIVFYRPVAYSVDMLQSH